MARRVPPAPVVVCAPRARCGAASAASANSFAALVDTQELSSDEDDKRARRRLIIPHAHFSSASAQR